MQDLQSLTEDDLKGLPPEAVAALAQQMRQRLRCQDSERRVKDAKIETINARSKVHTPRSTLASWSGQGGAALLALFDAQKRFVLCSQVLHVDETQVAMLDPGAGKTKRAYIWAYARGAFDAVPGVVYDFCVGRGAQSPMAFLGADGDERSRWRGTLIRDEYKAYDSVIGAEPERIAAGCLAHARRTPGASSTSCCARVGAAQLPPRHCSGWHRFTGSSVSLPDSLPRYGWTAGRPSPSRCGSSCMLGCSWSAPGCRRAARRPRR